MHSPVWPSPSAFLHQPNDQINWLRKKKKTEVLVISSITDSFMILSSCGHEAH